MLTAIIIDDELKGRIALKQKLCDYCPQVELLAEAGDSHWLVFVFVSGTVVAPVES